MTPLLAQGSRVDRSFERLYRRHVADVYHYALAVLRNASDAEDVTQTTFLNAYRAYQRGERPQAAQNWLIAIAHNVCRQRFRQSTRRPQEVAFDEDVADTIVDDDAPSAQDIRNALAHLAFNQRAALVMRELEGRSYAEIGEILGLSVSAVETLIFRARRALREQLEGSLTCGQAELAISRQVDGRLPRADRGALRAHLRECSECATFARSQRAQRAAFKALGAAPLPMSLTSLSSLFGGGGAAVGVGVAAKAAAVVATAALVGGVGYEGAKNVSLFKAGPAPGARAAAAPSPGGKRQAVSAVGAVASAAVAASANGAPKLKRPSASTHRAVGARSVAKRTDPGAANKAKTHGRGSAAPGSAHAASNGNSRAHSNAASSASRGRSSTAPGQTKSSGSSVSASSSRGKAHTKPVVKHVTVPKPQPTVPPGQADEAPKPPHPKTSPVGSAPGSEASPESASKKK
jgi:RNA polymerase sigma-70 factor (ECF subfamily)